MVHNSAKNFKIFYREIIVTCKWKVVQAAIIIFLNNTNTEKNKIFSTTFGICLPAFELSFSILTILLISIHQNHPTFLHVNSPQDACSGGMKSAIWIPNTLHKVKGQLNILILLSWHGQFYMNTFNAYNFLLYLYG
jgi:hypothetical protein